MHIATAERGNRGKSRAQSASDFSRASRGRASARRKSGQERQEPQAGYPVIYIADPNQINDAPVFNTHLAPLSQERVTELNALMRSRTVSVGDYVIKPPEGAWSTPQELATFFNAVSYYGLKVFELKHQGQRFGFFVKADDIKAAVTSRLYGGDDTYVLESFTAPHTLRFQNAQEAPTLALKREERQADARRVNAPLKARLVNEMYVKMGLSIK